MEIGVINTGHFFMVPRRHRGLTPWSLLIFGEFCPRLGPYVIPTTAAAADCFYCDPLAWCLQCSPEKQQKKKSTSQCLWPINVTEPQKNYRRWQCELIVFLKKRRNRQGVPWWGRSLPWVPWRPPAPGPVWVGPGRRGGAGADCCWREVSSAGCGTLTRPWSQGCRGSLEEMNSTIIIHQRKAIEKYR